MRENEGEEEESLGDDANAVVGEAAHHPLHVVEDRVARPLRSPAADIRRQRVLAQKRLLILRERHCSYGLLALVVLGERAHKGVKYPLVRLTLRHLHLRRTAPLGTRRPRGWPRRLWLLPLLHPLQLLLRLLLLPTRSVDRAPSLAPLLFRERCHSDKGAEGLPPPVLCEQQRGGKGCVVLPTQPSCVVLPVQRVVPCSGAARAVV